MNMIKSSHVVSRTQQRFSPTHTFIAAAAIAVLLLAALLSASEPTASEAQFDAKFKSAAAAVDSGFSDVQKFFPASFR